MSTKDNKNIGFNTLDKYVIPFKDIRAFFTGGYASVAISEKKYIKFLKDYVSTLSFTENTRFALMHKNAKTKWELLVDYPVYYVKPVAFEKVGDHYALTFKVLSTGFLIDVFSKETYKNTEEDEREKRFIDWQLKDNNIIPSRINVFNVAENNSLENRADIISFMEIFKQAIGAVERDLVANSEDMLIFERYLNSDLSITFKELESLIHRFQPAIPGENKEILYNHTLMCTILNMLKQPLYELLLQGEEYYVPSPILFEKLSAELLNFITSIMETETQIKDEISKKMNEQQKEFILREKIKTIQNSLEKMNVPVKEDDYAKQIKNKTLVNIYPDSIRQLIKDESKRISEMMQSSPEATLAKNYIDILKKLPWRIVESEEVSIQKVKETLDENHYGLDKVKERIFEYLAVIINQKNNAKKDEDDNLIPLDEDKFIDMNLFKENDRARAKKFNNVPILTLVGPPGTGKTSLSKSIAEALGRSFVKVSLGGVHDESEIRGHRRTYVGAMPGKIIKGIMQAKVSNPIILLDEIDKMKSDMKGDPASAMLEVLDPEQNSHFQDHYLEHEYDLSKAIFIATANYYEAIPEALLDRVEVIELSSYTLSEKLNIAREHLIPKVIEQTGLAKSFFKIDDETLKYIIHHYTKEAGVRGLKRLLDKIARKIVVKKLENKNMKSFTIKKEEITDLLGVILFKEEEKEDIQIPGIVNGLAYTSYGGSSLQIEVNAFPGKPEIKLTGSLKEVMQESAQIALSYVRSNAEKFGIQDFDFEENTIHIHVPEGAVPKDGPSAGVTFTTALISALSKKVVPSNIGMTGEITLRGKVLEIGGLKEKSFAASQKGLKYIFIPAANVKNLQDIPNEIKSELNYIPVVEYTEIYDFIFKGKQPKEIISFKEENK
ncbi:ATP-dependent protease La [Mycoplasmopsis glycophila]|uniref:endopeptidase La n=1 Tax=Mycoplasmopsis glycophila TaxID=171285 RepID=A0A449AVJ0_9BACT|nr:endopeptidase La [Mycoplasmopsis glycophila]VEU70568.1 ATP-dependent protease La [Mycoplasmopsis glycophila]